MDNNKFCGRANFGEGGSNRCLSVVTAGDDPLGSSAICSNKASSSTLDIFRSDDENNLPYVIAGAKDIQRICRQRLPCNLDEALIVRAAKSFSATRRRHYCGRADLTAPAG